MSRFVSNHLGAVIGGVGIGCIAILFMTLSSHDSSVTGTDTLQTLAVSDMVETPMVSPMTGKRPTDAELLEARPEADWVVTDASGRCKIVHLSDDNIRSCEDQPDWNDLPKEVDRGQYFRGESQD